MSESFFDPAPAPKTRLGHHRQLSPTAGVHVSPLVLGAASIGTGWDKIGMGEQSKENSFKLLDAFYDAGGNFIDTASNYQDETSEMFIGEWAEQRGIREQLVIGTKYTTDFKRGRKDVSQHSAYIGNHTKSLRVALDASLKKLRTDYIDILYVHWWDWHTSVEEVMNALHTVVQQGKVLYLGISDTPAWVVAQANTYACAHGKTPFVVYSGAWNVLDRSFERDIIPMARSLGLALAPWNVLASGHFRTDAEEEARAKSGEGGRTTFGPWMRNEEEKKISHALGKVANEVGAKNIGSVAIAYLLHRTPYVFPIIGGRKVEHLEANIEALEIGLKKEQMKYLESIVPLDPGFPGWFNGFGEEYPSIYMVSGSFKRVGHPQAITPEKQEAA